MIDDSWIQIGATPVTLARKLEDMKRAAQNPSRDASGELVWHVLHFFPDLMDSGHRLGFISAENRQHKERNEDLVYLHEYATPERPSRVVTMGHDDLANFRAASHWRYVVETESQRREAARQFAAKFPGVL